MTHYRGPRAARQCVVQAKQVALDPIRFEVPQDFADIEIFSDGECDETNSGWSGPGGCFPGYPNTRSKE